MGTLKEWTTYERQISRFSSVCEFFRAIALKQEAIIFYHKNLQDSIAYFQNVEGTLPLVTHVSCKEKYCNGGKLVLVLN